MKTLLGFFLIFLSLNFKLEKQAKGEISKWLISENSSLIVNGVTNVNKFSCAILPKTKTDTVMVTKGQSGAILLSGTLNININDFDCNNAIMTRELKKTLRVKAFPYLHIKFLSLKITDNNLQTKIIKGEVEIELAGQTKCFQIEYQLKTLKNMMILSGNQFINFSDFNLQPPTKMGRLIKAKDKLEVALYLKMELI